MCRWPCCVASAAASSSSLPSYCRRHHHQDRYLSRWPVITRYCSVIHDDNRAHCLFILFSLKRHLITLCISILHLNTFSFKSQCFFYFFFFYLIILLLKFFFLTPILLLKTPLALNEPLANYDLSIILYYLSIFIFNNRRINFIPSQWTLHITHEKTEENII